MTQVRCAPGRIKDIETAETEVVCEQNCSARGMWTQSRLRDEQRMTDRLERTRRLLAVQRKRDQLSEWRLLELLSQIGSFG